MKRAWVVAGLLTGLLLVSAEVGAQASGQAGAPASATSLTVSYMEGTASQQRGSSWLALSIGDQLPLDATVKLERLALVNFKSPAASITLTQPGTYLLRNLVEASASLRSAGALEAAAIAFSRVLKGTGKRVDAVGGVRSEVMPREDFNDIWDEGGPPGDSSPPSDTTPAVSPAGAAIRLARDLIAAESYQEAIDQLQAVIPTASEPEAREASFYLASACELSGDARSALAALSAASPKGDEEWAPDSVLLGARLLEDTFAWAQARDLLLKVGASLRHDEQRATTYLFLLALAYRGTGEKEKQDLVLDRIFALDPTSDLGQAAWKLRQAP